jgi:phosphatidate phosphatase APP1
MKRRLLQCGLALPLLAITIALPQAAVQRDAEEVIFYPTYGFKQGTDWIIPMRAKVQEPRDVAALIKTLFGRLPDPDASDTSHFKARIADFLADDESGEDVRLTYDNDPDRKEYRIADAAGRFIRTDKNGVVEGTLTLPEDLAQRLLTQQGSTSGWLTYHAISADHTGTGRVRLIGPTGVSVVSDIDDTIKVTEIPAGARVFVHNTFYRDFVPTTELSAKYAELGDAAFHYVSGGPWQLYRPVSTFLIGGKHFPEGTFHMKSLTGGIRTPVASLEDLSRFVLPGGTFEHKVSQITTLMKRFPGRKFVLIGDSGEQDPDVYRNIQTTFGAQVQAIIIRDLTNDRQLKPARLHGMTIVEAPTVLHGVSQLPR